MLSDNYSHDNYSYARDDITSGGDQVSSMVMGRQNKEVFISNAA
jgi:hypothetical protein